MGVFLWHPTTEAIIETTDIADDGGETQAELYESLGWERVDAVSPSFGDGPPILVEDDDSAEPIDEDAADDDDSDDIEEI